MLYNTAANNKFGPTQHTKAMFKVLIQVAWVFSFVL